MPLEPRVMLPERMGAPEVVAIQPVGEPRGTELQTIWIVHSYTRQLSAWNAVLRHMVMHPGVIGE